MRLLSTIIFTVFAIVLLLNSHTISQYFPHKLHAVSMIDGLIKYQFLAFSIALIAIGITTKLSPQSSYLLSFGDLSVIANEEKWLGINGRSSWLKNGLQLLFFISCATGIFMFLGVKYSDSLQNFHIWYIPYVLFFSLCNAFSEEIIFRYVIISGLQEHYPKIVVLIVSSVLFGIPHYFGNPSGVVGVIMSATLGYILAKATVETRGLGLAFCIHFIQDVIIFSAIMAMGIKE